MTPQEMHIGIDFILQKINTNVISSFRPEEKDWALNDEVIRFIKQRTNPLSNDKHQGLDGSQKRYDDLRALITPPLTLPVYVHDIKSVFGYLPSDYFSLVSDSSITKDLCGSPYAPVTTVDTFDIVCFPIEIDPNLFTTFQIGINGNLVFDLTTFVTGGLPTQSSSFYLVNLILQELNKLPNITAKYETFYDTYKAGNIIVVGKGVNVITSFVVEYALSTITYPVIVKTLNKLSTPIGSDEYANRLSKNEDIPTLLDSSFGTTLSHSPITSLENGKIIGYHKQKFILSNINIVYIKKPRKIDLSLNQGCELSESVHQEIVDNTAKRLAGLTNSQSYDKIINENLLKE